MSINQSPPPEAAVVVRPVQMGRALVRFEHGVTFNAVVSHVRSRDPASSGCDMPVLRKGLRSIRYDRNGPIGHRRAAPQNLIRLIALATAKDSGVYTLRNLSGITRHEAGSRIKADYAGLERTALQCGMRDVSKGELLACSEEHPASLNVKVGLLPNFPPVISRVRRLLTCPAKAYQVEVEETVCVIRLRPVWPAVFELNRLK